MTGHLTKKEASQRSDRSHRSLTRNVSTAMRTGAKDVLTPLKLPTENGTTRARADVSLEQIQDLSYQGRGPAWYVDEEWAGERYGPKHEVLKEVPTSATQSLN
ncbi:MAG: hypothetical protein KDA93_17455 [Planctomycetaceae bacterium]|nr:hypothetical protein [Planctomycetaceae bacterium]